MAGAGAGGRLDGCSLPIHKAGSYPCSSSNLSQMSLSALYLSSASSRQLWDMKKSGRAHANETEADHSPPGLNAFAPIVDRWTARHFPTPSDATCFAEPIESPPCASHSNAASTPDSSWLDHEMKRTPGSSRPLVQSERSSTKRVSWNDAHITAQAAQPRSCTSCARGPGGCPGFSCASAMVWKRRTALQKTPTSRLKLAIDRTTRHHERFSSCRFWRWRCVSRSASRS